jgi:hypothetical protein
LDDKEEVRRLSRGEKSEKSELLAKIPGNVRLDWLNRRALNLSVNKLLLKAAADGAFDYFALGRDDTAPFSQSHKEARLLSQEVQDARHSCRMFPGADQLGLLLLTKALLDREHYIPFVHAVYAEGTGRKTVPSYEDAPAGQTVNEHIYAAGGLPVRTANRADLTLFLNTPRDGATKEADAPENTEIDSGHTRYFIELIKKAAQAKRKIAVADIEFGNGASNALVAGLSREKLAYRLDAYAGGNTASNAVGYALSQGILAAYTPKTERDRLLTVRYTDDWAYQANVRGALYRGIVWPRGWSGAQLLDGQRDLLAAEALSGLAALTRKRLPESVRFDLKVAFPWNRLFEAEITLAANPAA